MQPTSLDKIELDIQSQVSRNLNTSTGNNDMTMKSMQLQTQHSTTLQMNQSIQKRQSMNQSALSPKMMAVVDLEDSPLKTNMRSSMRQESGTAKKRAGGGFKSLVIASERKTTIQAKNAALTLSPMQK